MLLAAAFDMAGCRIGNARVAAGAAVVSPETTQ
jgi:hypothetical protein